jgi:hypothetical protein
MKVYADGTLMHTEAVANERPFRLPSGFKAREWQIELSGTAEITSAMLASTVIELSAA